MLPGGTVVVQSARTKARFLGFDMYYTDPDMYNTDPAPPLTTGG